MSRILTCKWCGAKDSFRIRTYEENSVQPVVFIRCQECGIETDDFTLPVVVTLGTSDMLGHYQDVPGAALYKQVAVRQSEV